MVKIGLSLRLISGISALALFTAFVFMPTGMAKAQEANPDYPIYLVEEGDNLWEIARRFGVSIDELVNANGMTDAAQLKIGQELKIPGLYGITGNLVTITIPFGEDIHSFSRRTDIEEATLARLNRMTSPRELAVGANLILVENDFQSTNQGGGTQVQPSLLHKGDTLLEMAIEHQVNPWELLHNNRISHTWQVVQGNILLPKKGVVKGPGALPSPIASAELIPAPSGQGKTVTLRIKTNIAQDQSVSLSGSIAGNSLHFFTSGGSDGTVFTALLGLDNLIIPGYYPVEVKIEFSNGDFYSFSQPVYVRDSGYLYEQLEVKDKELLEPEKTEPEEEKLAAITAVFTPEKMWTGYFQSPVEDVYTDCWPSTFGRRRSYNGSSFVYIHNGLDFCGQVGRPIFAPAKGKVMFTGELFVRGNTTVIDHGWGVYTVYAHQSEIKVKVDDLVEPGQTIGLMGETGRVTGPHLHWEVWVGNIRVDPYDWLLGEYPAPENMENNAE